MTKRPVRTIQATWHAMLALQTIGTIDGQHKLPAPKQYVVHSIVWGIFFLIADTGAGRLAARLSVLMLLTASVIGPFGTRAVTFLQMIADRFAVTPPAPTAPGTEPTSPAGQPAQFA